MVDVIDELPAATAVYEGLMAQIHERRAELEATSADADALRTLPPPAVEILRELGIFWLKVPEELGGNPIDPLQFSDVIEELAYIDASLGWTAMIGAGSGGIAASLLPDDGAKEVFLDAPARPTFAGQPRARTMAKRVDGGFIVSGRWSFSSGIHHADWVIGGFHTEDEDPPNPFGTGFIVPKSQATVFDNWHVAGLAGTGSSDYALDEVFIPTTHTGMRRGVPPKRSGALWRQEPLVLVGNELPAVAVGIARRALDRVVEMAAGTIRGIGGTPLAERPAFQQALARAEVQWRAARLVYRDAVGEAWEAVLRDGQAPERANLAVATAQTYVTDACAEVVMEVVRFGGGRVIALSNPLQRHLRDALAARQHLAATDEHYERAAQEWLRRAHGEGTAP
ncbi:MAG: acyl-CoA dehydrogenase family protein [Acidimicrobiaceae bacterium]|nr:acyl-CoA dehydrogenase family protein [Acidimicrobiaceae bacterium]